MVRIVLWTAFGATLAILWGREALAYLAARRFGEACAEDGARFRRRSLGLVVLLALAAMADAGSWVEQHVDAPRMLAYYGLCFVMLIWLLMIATRDFRAVSSGWVRDRERAMAEFLDHVERDLDVGGGEDTRPIPRMKFPQKR